MVEATERKAEVAIGTISTTVRRVDNGIIEAEVERLARTIGATRPIVGDVSRAV